MGHQAASTRYDSMAYRRCGRSGLRPPALSLGLWHNFGGSTPLPAGSRAGTPGTYLDKRLLTEENLSHIRALSAVARARGQKPQMALAWVLRDPRVTSALIGASSAEQISENVGAHSNLRFTTDELACIDKDVVEGGINLLAQSSEAG